MAKYKFKVTEYSYGVVTVEAENKEDAISKVEDAYFEGKTDWTGGDWSFGDCEKVEG